MAPQPSPEAQAQGSPKRRHWLRNGRPYTAAAGFKYSEKLLEFGLPQPGRLAPMSRVMQPSLSLADDQWVDDLRLSASQRDIRSYSQASLLRLAGEALFPPGVPLGDAQRRARRAGLLRSPGGSPPRNVSPDIRSPAIWTPGNASPTTRDGDTSLMPVAEVLVRAAKAAALASCKSNIHSLLSNGGTGGHSAPTTAGNEARLRGSRAASHEAPPPRTFKAMAAMKRNLGNVFASKEQ